MALWKISFLALIVAVMAPGVLSPGVFFIKLIIFYCSDFFVFVVPTNGWYASDSMPQRLKNSEIHCTKIYAKIYAKIARWRNRLQNRLPAIIAEKI